MLRKGFSPKKGGESEGGNPPLGVTLMRNPFLQVIFFIRGPAPCGEEPLLMVGKGECACSDVLNVQNGPTITIMCGSAFFVSDVGRSLNVCPLICECKLSFLKGSQLRRNSSMPQCSRCGNFHATPRQNKNCERRSRSKSPAVAASGFRQPVFKSAYFKRLYSLGVIVDDD